MNYCRYSLIYILIRNYIFQAFSTEQDFNTEKIMSDMDNGKMIMTQ
jgi:hypothetical protein